MFLTINSKLASIVNQFLNHLFKHQVELMCVSEMYLKYHSEEKPSAESNHIMIKLVAIVVAVLFVKLVVLEPDPVTLFFKYFVVFDQNLTYRAAKVKCNKWETVNSTRKFWLASNITEKENAIIYNFISFMGYNRAWIGYNRMIDEYDEDIFTFNQEQEDGSVVPVSKYFWAPDEPNNFRRLRERCVEIRVKEETSETSNWNDIPCDYERIAICRNPYKIRD